MRTIVASVLMLSLAACAHQPELVSAHLIEPKWGVVAVPDDKPKWKDKADAIMADFCGPLAPRVTDRELRTSVQGLALDHAGTTSAVITGSEYFGSNGSDGFTRPIKTSGVYLRFECSKNEHAEN